MSYIKLVASCIHCKSEITVNNLSIHYKSKQCLAGGKASLIKQVGRIAKNPSELTIFSKICSFCSTHTTNKRHESLCKANPNQQRPLNQYSHAKLTGIPYIISQSTIDKQIISNTGKVRSKETIQKLTASMKLAVLKYPESYSEAKNNHRTKVHICTNGFKVRGKWELAFVEFCIVNNIAISQVRESFSYTYDMEEHQYFPDFYLKDFDIFVEVKGWKSIIDEAKWDSLTNNHYKTLLIIDKRVIEEIKKNSITIYQLLNTYLH